MKLKYLFGMVLAALLVVGCASDDNTLGSLSNITLDKTYVCIPESGGSATVNITATEDWQLSGLTDWLTANVTSGTAGETQMTLTADVAPYGREAELQIAAGQKTQFFLVRQGLLDAATATCAEVLAGLEGKTYRLKGTCTAISNTTYGNWYISDGTGEVYIYGTLDADGKTQNFSSLGIEVGDVVEVEGPMAIYNSTIELKDVTVVSIEKWMVQSLSPDTVMPREGGEMQVRLIYKGSGAYPEVASECRDWVQYVGTDVINGEEIDTAVVRFNVAENTGGVRSGEITFTSSSTEATSSITYSFSQAGVGGTVDKPYTVAEAIAAAQAGTGEVYVKGIVCADPSVSVDYGNATYYISDDGTNSDSLQIYRGLYLNGEKFTDENQLKQGDVVVVVGSLKMYNQKAEMDKNNYIYSLLRPGTVAYALAGVEGETYRVKGTCTEIKNDTYGNWYLQDETGEIYIYGTLDADGNTKNFSSLGIEVGDVVDVEGPLVNYNGTIELKNVTVLSITKATE